MNLIRKLLMNTKYGVKPIHTHTILSLGSSVYAYSDFYQFEVVLCKGKHLNETCRIIMGYLKSTPLYKEKN